MRNIGEKIQGPVSSEKGFYTELDQMVTGEASLNSCSKSAILSYSHKRNLNYHIKYNQDHTSGLHKGLCKQNEHTETANL